MRKLTADEEAERQQSERDKRQLQQQAVLGQTVARRMGHGAERWGLGSVTLIEQDQELPVVMISEEVRMMLLVLLLLLLLLLLVLVLMMLLLLLLLLLTLSSPGGERVRHRVA